jgi:SAM-dependent methyltransferase
MNGLTRLLVRGADAVNRRGKSVGVRLVKFTGKRPYAIHPKHLVEQPWHDWYVPYLTPSDRVLDVGTSNGAHLLQAAPHCSTIVGVDYDVAQLLIAGRAIHERSVPNARIFAWDLTQPLPFGERAFDTILFLDVIEHLVPRVAVLRELHRLLADDGQLLVSAPNSQTRWRAALRRAGLFAYSDPDHKIEYTTEEFVAELRAGGFELEGALMPVVLDTPLAGAIDAVGGLSLLLYDRLSRWKRQAALRRPGESTGFRARARKIRR